MVIDINQQNDQFGQTQPEQVEDTEKLQCEAKGGTWDPLTRTCKLPEIKSPEVQEIEARGTIPVLNTLPQAPSQEEQAPALRLP